MSMISAQIDELRELAGDGSMEWVVGPVRASVLRDAADTIWQLRDDLQMANAENDKLRLLAKATRTYQYMDTDADPLAALQLNNAITVMYDELRIEVDE